MPSIRRNTARRKTGGNSNSRRTGSWSGWSAESKRRKGRPLRLLGVGVTQLVHSGETQPLLIEDEGSKKNRKIDDAMDSLQDRYGTDVIHRGSGRRKARDTFD